MKKILAICFVVLAVSASPSDARPFRCFHSCRTHRCEKLQCHAEPTQCECCSACEGVEAMSSGTDFSDLQIELNNLRKDVAAYKKDTDSKIADLKKEIAKFTKANPIDR
jgi:hypothetical protein